MNEDIINQKAWDEFRASGLLWWINMILHTFGWAIVVEVAEDGAVTEAYPARVKFRGFDTASNTDGYIKISKYMADNAHALEAESRE